MQEKAVGEVCLNAMLDWLSATHVVNMQVAHEVNQAEQRPIVLNMATDKQ